MKSMQLIDKKRVLNIVTAMNIIGYSKDPYVGAQSKDKNSEVIGFADMGFNAAVQASKMSSIYGGYFEENI